MSSGYDIEIQGFVPVETPDFEVPAQSFYDAAEELEVRAYIVNAVGGKFVKHAIHHQEVMSEEVTVRVARVRDEIERINEQSKLYGGKFMVYEQTPPFFPRPGIEPRRFSSTEDERRAFELHRDRPRYERISPLYGAVLLEGTSIKTAVFSGNALTDLVGLANWQKPFTEDGGNIGDGKRAAFDKVVRHALEELA
jgi:hypothetical protein